MTIEYTPITTFTNAGPYSLDKVSIPNVHIYRGREFPIAYSLNLHGNQYDQSKVESLLESFSKDGTFTNLIEKHGSVVLRDVIQNSDSTKYKDASRFINIIESTRGKVEFKQIGTLGARIKLADNYYIASKSPSHLKLLQHNEFSRFKQFPTTLVFTILEYTASGGETTLVHGGELYEKVEKELPNFLEKLKTHGLTYVGDKWVNDSEVKFNRISWREDVAFGRDLKEGDSLETQKLKVEKITKEFVSDEFQWDEQGDFIVQFTATKPVRKFKGEQFLFSSLANFSLKQVVDPSITKVRYGNDELFNEEDLAKYRQLVLDLEYKHLWKSGDLVFIHNYLVSHGKNPYSSEGKREIHVSMWDDLVPSSITNFYPSDDPSISIK